jgi:hypothetical protein
VPGWWRNWRLANGRLKSVVAVPVALAWGPRGGCCRPVCRGEPVCPIASAASVPLALPRVGRRMLHPRAQPVMLVPDNSCGTDRVGRSIRRVLSGKRAVGTLIERAASARLCPAADRPTEPRLDSRQSLRGHSGRSAGDRPRAIEVVAARRVPVLATSFDLSTSVLPTFDNPMRSRFPLPPGGGAPERTFACLPD